MPRNDRSDSLSVREEEDPRRTMKGMQQEVELEFGRAEGSDTGGVEHQGARDRDGVDRGGRPEEQATRRRTERDGAEGAHIPLSGGGGEASASSAEREAGPGPRVNDPGNDDDGG